jgi:hypothetical protein
VDNYVDNLQNDMWITFLRGVYFRFKTSLFFNAIVYVDNSKRCNAVIARDTAFLSCIMVYSYKYKASYSLISEMPLYGVIFRFAGFYF